MAGFPENNIDDEDFEDDLSHEDEVEYSRTRRWEPHDDDVENMIDFSDDED